MSLIEPVQLNSSKKRFKSNLKLNNRLHPLISLVIKGCIERQRRKNDFMSFDCDSARLKVEEKVNAHWATKRKILYPWMENKKPWKLYQNILEKIMWKIHLYLTFSNMPWCMHVCNLTTYESETTGEGPYTFHISFWSMDALLRFKKSSFPFLLRDNLYDGAYNHIS